MRYSESTINFLSDSCRPFFHCSPSSTRKSDTKMANSYALFEWFSGISSATTSNIFMQFGHMSEKMKMKLLQKTTSSYLLPFMRSLGPEIAKIDKTLWMSQNQRNVILFFHDYKSSQVRNSYYLLFMYAWVWVWGWFLSPVWSYYCVLLIFIINRFWVCIQGVWRGVRTHQVNACRTFCFITPLFRKRINAAFCEVLWIRISLACA